MPDYTITVEDVGATFADADAYIAVVDQADGCLAANGVADAVGRQMKILAVRHLSSSATDVGNVVSRRSIDGASITYSDGGGDGYLSTLKMLDKYGCVLRLIVNNANVRLMSIGRYNA